MTYNQGKALILGGLTSVAILLIAVACTTPNKASQELKYSRDDRTGLCFASWALNANNAIMTNVPCNPSVQKLIEANKETEK